MGRLARASSDAFCHLPRGFPQIAPRFLHIHIPLVAKLVEREKEMIENALVECEGRISGQSGAAAKLGIPRQTLESKITKLGINRYRFKTA